MMKMFGWHTAERGIIRDAQGEIVAINRNIPSDPLDALLVLRSKLDEYMEAKGMVLFWSLVGQKLIGSHPNALIESLTGAAAYKVGEEIDIIQPLRKEPPAPKHERVKLKQEDFPSISGNLIDQMNEMDEEELLRMLSEEFENKKDKGSEND